MENKDNSLNINTSSNQKLINEEEEHDEQQKKNTLNENSNNLNFNQYIINNNINKIIIPTQGYILLRNPYLFIAILLFLFSIIYLAQKKIDLSIIMLYSFFISYIIYLFIRTLLKKLEIDKDISNNTITVRALNCFKYSFKKLVLKNNIHFYIGHIYEDHENNTYFNRLFIIKDFNNCLEIDLDTSNIRQTPIKIFYYFDYISPKNKEIDEYEKELNAFMGASQNYICPFIFDIKEYMHVEHSVIEKQYEEMLKFQPELYKISQRFKYSQYMKLCERFFTYYVSEPFSDDKNKILRIDFIYSENFDRIFIGIVQKNEKAYIDTFEFNMNKIDKFVLEKIHNKNKGYNLEVQFKDKGQKRQICALENDMPDDLKGIVYLLNEKLNNNEINNNKNNDINDIINN